MKRITTAWILCAAMGFGLACGPSKKELQAELDKTRAALEDSQSRSQTLEQKIASLEKELLAQNARLDELIEERGMSEKELAELRAEQKRREAELETYKKLFAKLKKLIDAGTIKVVFRKGKMMVEMASAVLFDSGKTELKDNGKQTLAELTEALKSVADRDFLIAGHTDNVPIKTRRFRSNWDLSAARAVEVTNFMIEQGFPAQHLGAAGFGEFDPVAANDTEAGRQQNRRIEIVLVPDLGEIKGIREMIEGES